MYLEHFQLSSEPFSLTPDPAFLYKSEIHTEALAALKLGLLERRGLIAMVGEVGTGKTTLLYTLLSSLGPRIRTAYVSNTKLSFDGLLRSALKDFGRRADGTTRLDLLEELNDFLLDCDRQGHTAALIVDEAQNLSDDAFEELRLLSNYETYKRKLLQIVLVGQPELDAKLRKPSLRQVAERVAVRTHVNPLGKQETLAYIEHRLSSVGGTSQVFTTGALNLIAKRSLGIPRRINVLCHNAMLYAYGRDLAEIDKALVVTAMRERSGTGLVKLDRGFFPSRSGGARLVDSSAASGLAWALGGLLVGIVGALFYLSNFGDAGSARRDEIAVPRTTLNSDAAIDTVIPAAQPAVASLGQTSDPPSSHPTAASAALEVAITAAAPADSIAEIAQATALPTDAVNSPLTPTADEHRIAAIRQRNSIATEKPATPPPPAPEIVATATVPVNAPLKQAVNTAGVVEVSTANSGRTSESLVTVAQGATLIELAVAIYGDYSPEILKTVRTANPQIENPDLIVAGDRFKFPDLTASDRNTEGGNDE